MQYSLIAIFIGSYLLLPLFTQAGEPPTTPFIRLNTEMHSAQIMGIASNSSGKLLATASYDKTVKIWDASDGKLVRTIRPPIGADVEGTLNTVVFSADGKLVATGGDTGSSWNKSFSVYVFDVHSGEIAHHIKNLPQTITRLAYSPDGSQLAIAFAENKGVSIFRTSDYNLIRHDDSFIGNCLGMDFDKKGNLAVGTDQGIIKVYRPNGTLAYEQKSEKEMKIHAIRFSPNGKFLAIGNQSMARNIEVLNAIDGSPAFLLTRTDAPYRAAHEPYAGIAWSNDGEYILASGYATAPDERILLFKWSVDDKRMVETAVLPTKSYVRDIIALRNGSFAFISELNGFGVLSGSVGKRIRLEWINAYGRKGVNDYTEMSLNGGGLVYYNQMNTADFRRNHDLFKIAPDASAVKFSYSPYGKSKALFDLKKREILTDDLPETANFISPRFTADGIDIQGWDSWKSFPPRLNDKILECGFSQRDRNFSLAVKHDDSGFVLGSTLYLRSFNKDGYILWQKRIPGIAWDVNISADNSILVAALDDGTIRWYRLDNGLELYSVYLHPDKKRWILWTPEGYYDASPEAADLIAYHLNQGENKAGRIISNGQLYDVFYRPDIVQAKIRGEDISFLSKINVEEALQNPPPIVAFTKAPVSSSNVIEKICYKATSTGGGIGELRLFQNGKLVKSDGFYRESVVKESTQKTQLASLNSRAIYKEQRSLAVLEKKSANTLVMKSKGNLVEECVEIEPISGENEISLAAFNAANTVQSFMTTVSFNSTRNAEEGHLYILAVGIDNYNDSSINLKYAAKDAIDFITKLPEKARSIYNSKNIHLTTLTNLQATKQGIMKAVEDLTAEVKHSDGFVFFNASHGVLLQNQYFMITADFNGDLSNTGSLISSNEIVEISKRIKSLSQLFIFDTCHAGGVDNIISGLYDARMSVMAKKMGLHIYASAGSVQTALDGYKGNGLFTHSLLQGIENGKDVDKEKSGKVSIKNLGLYSKEKTSEISTKLGHPQTPFIINFGKDNPLFAVK